MHHNPCPKPLTLGAHRHRHTHTHRHTQTHTQTDRHTNRHTDRHTDRHTQTDTQTDTQRHTERHTHTHMHTRAHTHTTHSLSLSLPPSVRFLHIHVYILPCYTKPYIPAKFPGLQRKQRVSSIALLQAFCGAMVCRISDLREPTLVKLNPVGLGFRVLRFYFTDTPYMIAPTSNSEACHVH